MRAAVLQRKFLNIEPAIVIAEPRTSAETEAFCHDHAIEFVRVETRDRDLFNKDLTQSLELSRLDLLSLTFDKIIPEAAVSLLRHRIINVHPALLPSFRGIGPMQKALDSGARFGGATIHEVDEKVDHGPIIAQLVLAMRRTDDAKSFGARMFGMLRLMYLQVIRWYAMGRVEYDSLGKIWIRDATYGELPISPAIEDAFPE
jgi:phosphoribosylglycinamide formyltransferase 1